MEDTIISLETAKLAKEKGFKSNTQANYWILAKDHSENYKNKLPIDWNKVFLAKNSQELENFTYIDEKHEHNVYHVLSIPTQSLLQKWLREIHNIHILVDFDYSKKCFNYHIWWLKTSTYWDDQWWYINSKTYEEGLEIGLQEGLKLIINL